MMIMIFIFTTFCIFNVFPKGKLSLGLILVFIYLSEQTSEILLLNLERYFIL